MKRQTAVFKILILVSFLMISTVSAVVLHPELVDFNKTMAYSDLGLTGSQDIQIWVGSTLVETGNSTAGYLYQPIGDFHVVTKPQLFNRWLSNPAYLLTDTVDYLGTFAVPLFVFIGFGAILIGLANYGRRR